MTFEDLKLTRPLLKAVAGAGYHQPSPIQQQAIPPVLAGRDVLGCAQTGTGKTAAFALPILQRLAAEEIPSGRRPIRALIMTPTRELALQIQESFALYGKHLPLRSTVIFGGVGQAPQVAALKKGVDILVATPGRLNDLIGQGYIRLHGVSIFVLDEADRMLDMGFVRDVQKVIRILPKKRQNLLFSATMPKEITALADQILDKPAKVFVTPESTTVESIEQKLYKVSKADKRQLLARLLHEQKPKSALVFTRTKHGADRVVRDLKRDGIEARAIHGNKSQTARQDALARLKDGRVKVLVATDIAARGLDINELSHVFNYDLPNVPETYVHRIGRTGRAGRGGIAVSFCNAEEAPYLADIEKLIGFRLPRAGAAEEGLPSPTQNLRRETMEKPKENTKNRQENTKNRQENTKNNQNQQDAAKKRRPRSKQGGRGRKGPLPPFDPYENLQGGKAIVTKTPVWGSGESTQGEARPAKQQGGAQRGQQAQQPQQQAAAEGSGQNRRRRGGRNRGKGGKAPEAGGKPLPEIKKDARGLFKFSDEELSQDESIRLIRDDTEETKFASFEDYLKDH